MSRRIPDRQYPYRSVYDDPYPPAPCELEQLRRQMDAAKVHLMTWAREQVQTGGKRG